MINGPGPDQWEYWEKRYQQRETPWDIGQPNDGLIALVISNFPRSARLLIPGAGVGHEAGKLYAAGFTDIHVCDWSPSALSAMHSRYPDIPVGQLLPGDFFELDSTFDGIIEQTFFCALPPDKRADYVRHCHTLLRPGGIIISVLFNRSFEVEGPPFGGSIEEYRSLFMMHFELIRLEPWMDSIPPRAGSECVIIARKKDLR